MFDFPTQLNFVDRAANKVHFKYIHMLPCIVESIQTNFPIFKCRIRARRGNDFQNSIYILHNYSYILLMWPLKKSIISKFYVYFTHPPTKFSKALHRFSKLHVQFTHGLSIFFQCPFSQEIFFVCPCYLHTFFIYYNYFYYCCCCNCYNERFELRHLCIQTIVLLYLTLADIYLV